VEQISRIGMDTSKHIFQLHGVNAAEQPVLRKKLRRKEMFAFLETLAPTVIAIEACGASHHCARVLQSFGHSVKLIAPQLVKPYLKRGKNDAADAEALCEAMSRPTMRFVPVKTAEQQAALMLIGVRDRLIRNRTQLSADDPLHRGRRHRRLRDPRLRGRNRPHLRKCAHSSGLGRRWRRVIQGAVQLDRIQRPGPARGADRHPRRALREPDLPYQGCQWGAVAAREAICIS
jgi:transposase